MASSEMEREDTGSRATQEISTVNTQHDANSAITLVDIIDVIADRIDPLLKLVEAFFKQSIEAGKTTATVQIRMAWLAAVIVFLIVGVSGTLTYFDKIDGATFTFLLGLVVGYVLTFVRDTIHPSEY